MSEQILDCLKRKRDICIKNIIPSQNTAFRWTPALSQIALRQRFFPRLRLCLRPKTRQPVACYPPPVIRYPSPATRHPLPVTRYPSPATRYPPPATRYPLPATRYPPPVTRYPPPVEKCCRNWKAAQVTSRRMGNNGLGKILYTDIEPSAFY